MMPALVAENIEETQRDFLLEEDTLRKWYLVDWKEVFFQKSTHFEEVISSRLEFFLLSAAEKHEGSLGISRLEEFNWFLLA